MPLLIYPPGKESPLPIGQEAGWAPEPGLFYESLNYIIISIEADYHSYSDLSGSLPVSVFP
jgi:hypothetical protein